MSSLRISAVFINKKSTRARHPVALRSPANLAVASAVHRLNRKLWQDDGFGDPAIREGAYGVATATLHKAARLAQHKKASALSPFLPVPPPGWTTGTDVKSAGSVKPAIGVTVASTYTANAKTVSVAIVTDSPYSASLVSIFLTPPTPA